MIKETKINLFRVLLIAYLATTNYQQGGITDTRVAMKTQ